MTPIDVEALLEEVSSTSPCGPNLEYDPAFLELEWLSRTSPDSATHDTLPEAAQPDWRQVSNKAFMLFQCTKDLRIAMILLRALANIQGWTGLRDGLHLLRLLLERHWETVHPQLDTEDADDPTQRLNILAALADTHGLIHDLYTANLIETRHGHPFTLREVEAAFGSGLDTDANPAARSTIDIAWQSADESEIRETVQALMDAADHLVVIESILASMTGRDTSGMRAELAVILGRAMQQLSNAHHRGALDLRDILPLKRAVQTGDSGRADEPSDSLPVEDLDDRENRPAFKQLHEARNTLENLIDQHRPSRQEYIPSDWADTEEPAIPMAAPNNQYMAKPDTIDVLPAAMQPQIADREPICPVDEEVQFTVYRPNTLVADQWHDLFAFAHQAESFPEVQQQAMSLLKERLSDYNSVRADSTEAIPRDGLVTFAPQVPGVQFKPPTRSFRWIEAIHLEPFRIRAHPAFGDRRISGRLSVFLDSILIAEVTLAFRVVHAEQPAAKAKTVSRCEAHPYRKIFPSYAHKDTPIVQQFEHYAQSLGDHYLRDVTTLRAGEIWDERLKEMIKEADVFQLFWSWHSMASPFVRHEWESALALGRAHFIRPVYWEEPFPSDPDDDMPPPALSRLHFQRIPWAASGSPSN